MSDSSTQQYILKPGHRIAFPEDNPEVSPGHYVMVLAPGDDVTDSITTIQRTLFERHFVLLDIPAIEKQLETIISEMYVFDQETGQYVFDRPKAIKEIKSLFGLENTEESK